MDFGNSNITPHQNTEDLPLTAREIFNEAMRAVDARQAVRNAVAADDEKLTIVDGRFELKNYAGVFSVALGKAARPMAAALSEILGARLEAGVISAPHIDASNSFDEIPAGWRKFAGGHPLPNAESIAAGRAAIELLERADEVSKEKQALVIFLVSGGGSALMELPRANGVTLEELRAGNKTLVECGATIAEINAVRRAWSQIKGGGLRRAAGRAAQVSLIVSDTNESDEASVASGPTFISKTLFDAKEIVARYNLAAKLPPLLIAALESPDDKISATQSSAQKHYILLDNRSVIESAARAAEARGFVVEIVRDLVESPIAKGCAELVGRLMALRSRCKDKIVCLVSGGEFVCPVRGGGVGGRNSEAALRCAIEFNKRMETFKNQDDTTSQNQNKLASPRLVALHAGTDGIDGNSPAAGAIGDDTTLERAASCGLDAHEFLARSDAYTFFEKLGDAIITGATGTNVRDLRILLAR